MATWDVFGEDQDGTDVSCGVCLPCHGVWPRRPHRGDATCRGRCGPWWALLAVAAGACGPAAPAPQDGVPAPDAALPQPYGSADAAPAVGYDIGDTVAHTAPDVGSPAPGDASDDVARSGDGADAAPAADAVGPPPADWPVFPAPLPRPPVGLYDCTAPAEALPPPRPEAVACLLDPACDRLLVVGHRGAGGQMGTIAPENSLAAIRAAIVMGLDGVELDVRDTADGGLVLMHDATVDRTTTGSGSVDQMTLADIGTLALRVDHLPEGDFACEHVPTLAEALALARDHLFVDLDTKTDRVDLVVDAIVAADMLDSVVVSTGSIAKALQARAAHPGVRIQVRPDSLDAVATWTARFDPDPDVYEVDPPWLAEAAPVVHALGRRVFVNAFEADALAYLTGDWTGYAALVDGGADIVQTELIPSLLAWLGRWPY